MCLVRDENWLAPDFVEKIQEKIQRFPEADVFKIASRLEKKESLDLWGAEPATKNDPAAFCFRRAFILENASQVLQPNFMLLLEKKAMIVQTPDPLLISDFHERLIQK